MCEGTGGDVVPQTVYVGLPPPGDTQLLWRPGWLGLLCKASLGGRCSFNKVCKSSRGGRKIILANFVLVFWGKGTGSARTDPAGLEGVGCGVNKLGSEFRCCLVLTWWPL